MAILLIALIRVVRQQHRHSWYHILTLFLTFAATKYIDKSNPMEKVYFDLQFRGKVHTQGHSRQEELKIASHTIFVGKKNGEMHDCYFSAHFVYLHSIGFKTGNGIMNGKWSSCLLLVKMKMLRIERHLTYPFYEESSFQCFFLFCSYDRSS